MKQITLTVLSNERNSFPSRNTGIVGSYPTGGMDVCMCVYSLFVLSCLGSDLATGWSLVQGVLPTVCKICIPQINSEMGTGQKV
jgi:hypothetical protein